MKILCPVDDFTCPYWKDGLCQMEAMEGCLPFRECDDFIDYEPEEFIVRE